MPAKSIKDGPTPIQKTLRRRSYLPVISAQARAYLFIILGVGLAHLVLLALLSQHKYAQNTLAEQSAIQIVIVSPPPVEEQLPPEILRPKTIDQSTKKRPKEKPPTRKSRPSNNNKIMTDEAQNSKPPDAAARYGAYLVRPWAAQGSALEQFYRGFNCARLNAGISRRNCTDDPVNLVQGMEAKIAAVSVLMARRGITRADKAKWLGVDPSPPGSTQPLTTKGPTGAPAITENFDKIPPKYRDPGFGD